MTDSTKSKKDVFIEAQNAFLRQENEQLRDEVWRLENELYLATREEESSSDSVTDQESALILQITVPEYLQSQLYH